LTLLRRTARNREKLAAALQVAMPRYHDVVARVSFGAPLGADQGDAPALCAAVAAQMRQLILAQEAA
jgi:hypothetical protein